ncbi:hypothetical protein [Methylomicrobium agile]|uniref:hypothetical protein n=1 Tax=Methylomicrobium agile TaxID=39774 RepID=UPI0004DFB336|nr:hypothetical protein [Methylomicrobium agile]
MNTTQWLQTKYLPIPLIALMVLTRYHHFGDALHLPDASLAVFFFAGFYRKPALLAFLLILAGLIDYLAIANGTSAYCISPAYVFMIPTYGVMWLAGRYCGRYKTFDRIGLPLNVGMLMLASTAAFLISNGSFYLLSGRFEEVALSAYIAGGLQYYLPYVGSTLLYVAAGYALVKLLAFLPALQSRHTSA